MKADDFGRFHASPKLLRSLLFPLLIDSVRDADCSRWIAECEKAGLVRVYEVEGKELLEIINFGQRLRAQKSTYPPPTAAVICQQSAAECGNSPPEEKRRELEEEVEVKENVCTQHPEAGVAVPDAVPLMMFPVVAPDGQPKEWALYADKVADYQATYPGIDAEAEARKARQWCIDNQSKRKTASGMPRFLNSWMVRAQNDSGSRGVKSPPGLQSGAAGFLEWSDGRH